MIKKVYGLLILLIVCGMLTSCYDRREVDEMAYVVAVGLDKGKSNLLKITLQIAVPTAVAGGGGGGGNSSGEGGGQKKGAETISTTTVEAPALHSGLDLINNYISKELNLSHAKLLIFSEELAREGIHKYIHEIMRGREFRTNLYVAVARGSAENYLRNALFFLEVNPSKYYEMDFTTYKYTGFSANTQLINFYLQEECTCRQAVATLVGVNKYEKSDEFNAQDSTFTKKGRDIPMPGDYTAGNLPKIYDIKTEIMGLAVFDGGTMVGELDGAETATFLISSGELKRLSLTVPDPMEENKFIELDLRQRRKPIYKIRMAGDNPLISLKALLEADITSIQSGINYEQGKNHEILEKSAEEFIQKGLEWYLDKTKALETDITGFGRKMKAKFLFWDDWMAFNWLDKYAKASFEVEVDLKIRRTGIMVRSEPARSNSGEERN